ncbi:Phox-like protein [Exidia glandulosa HHB12029]|uniref:Phox-like protein n=1 Tax=Exidia glandulosa HHB12029 TaxID=1314781 RepID=A0A165PCA3_EXIGL|nr:Phox-like protein [Exidia glandulosa HHB12029]
MTTIQAITIPEYKQVDKPKPHTAFKIVVTASVKTWETWRRYSEFDDLHDELARDAGAPPPAELPPKHSFSFLRTQGDPALLEERRQGLERYLRAILSSRDPRWRECFAFKDFIATPIGKGNTAPDGGAQFTAASWLDEQLDLQALSRDIRAETNKRDALAQRGDVSGSHTANVQAKKKLAALVTRVGVLASALGALSGAGMSEGEVQRRTDMVARLNDDCEKLSRIIVAGRTARVAAAPASAQQASAERAELMQSAGTTQAGVGAGRILGAPASRPPTRVFGQPRAPQETEETRPLDNHGLLQLQGLQIEQQDQHLDRLSAILERQKNLGLAIGQEIAEQIEILDQFNDEVDSTGQKLQSAKTQMGKLR